MAGTIQDILQIIKNGIYGRDIRQAIYDGIEMCYNDVITPTGKQEIMTEMGTNNNNLYGNDEGLMDVGLIRVSNSKVVSNTGVISSDSNFDRSDYTPTYGGTRINFSVAPINICFYTKHKEFVIGYGSEITTAAIPLQAEFFIITVNSGHEFPSTQIENAVPLTLRKTNEATTLLGDFIRGDIYPNNLITNMFLYTDHYYVGYEDGYLHPEENVGSYFATDYIPIEAGKTYKANLGRNHAWYDSSKTFISGGNGTGIQTGITAPENAAYIRFTINKVTDGISTPAKLYFAESDKFSTAVTIPNLDLNQTWCYGKKINWIGDSIVDGQDFDEEVCSALGLVKDNEYGINGSTIALKADGTDGRTALCERYSQMTNDADIIAVSCGTNDFEYAWCPIGTIDSTEKTTFYGALKVLCEGLINKYPKKVIFFTTPIKRAQPFADGAGGEYTADGVMTTPFSKNKYGKTLKDYADIIKEVCGYYSIPVLDMYSESLLNPHLASQQDMFDNVYTHPNTTAQKIMARRVAGWITQLGYSISGLN